MKKEDLFEVRREIFHILMGIVIILMAISFNWVNYFLFYILIGGIILTILSLKFKIPGIYFMLKIFERERFLKTFPGKGVLFFAAGCLLALKLFDIEIALASIAILTVVDSIPPLIKLTKIKRKRVIGIISGAILAWIVANIFVNPLLAAVGAITGIIAEAILLKSGPYEVDDNLIVPLVAGTFMLLFSGYFI